MDRACHVCGAKHEPFCSVGGFHDAKAYIKELRDERDLFKKALEEIARPCNDSPWPKVTELMDIAEQALHPEGEDEKS